MLAYGPTKRKYDCIGKGSWTAAPSGQQGENEFSHRVYGAAL